MGVLGSVRRVVRRAIAGGLFYSGVLGAYRRRVMSGAGVILLYHRIIGGGRELLDYSPSGMTVSRDDFAAQMAYVARHYRVVSLAELACRVSGELPMADRLCAVSFDDGWRDNYTQALPILKKHEIPATIFLTPHFIDGGSWFWEERLKYLLAHIVQCLHEGEPASEQGQVVRDTLQRLELGEITEMALPRFCRFLSQLVIEWRLRNETARHELLGELEQLLQLPGLQEPRRFMNWQEIHEMADAGVSFGAHTLSHVNLELCTLGEAEREIGRSKAVIEQNLGCECNLFAYPFGKVRPPVRSIVADNGFSGAVIITPGLVRPGCDPLQLQRIDITQRLAPNLSSFACGITPILRGL
ncbi:polysaccharide deacetylase family protein [bacterium]|nr:polysaccharide deacetylase family protein [bacterium]